MKMSFTLQRLFELENSVQLRQKVRFKGNLKCFIKQCYFSCKLLIVPTESRDVVCSHVSRPALIQPSVRWRTTAPCTCRKIPALCLSWVGNFILVHSERQENHNPAQTNPQHQILLYPLPLPQHKCRAGSRTGGGRQHRKSCIQAWIGRDLEGPSSTSLYWDFPAGILEDWLHVAFQSPLFVCLYACD